MQDEVLERLAQIRGTSVGEITSKRLTMVPLGRASEPYETAGFIFFSFRMRAPISRDKQLAKMEAW